MRLRSWCYCFAEGRLWQEKGSMARVVKIGPDSNGAVLSIEL